jgi:hypothetical protein
MVREERISAEEEITISYVDPAWPAGLRRETLKRDYGFECNCTRCVAEMDNSSGGDLKIT